MRSSRAASMFSTARISLSADPGSAAVRPLPKWIEQCERGRELHPSDVLAGAEVGVQPPPEALIEALRPIDVRDGQRHDLEPHVHALSALHPARRFAACVGAGHVDLHRLVSPAESRVIFPVCARWIPGRNPGTGVRCETLRPMPWI